jgi:aspartokinase/homoserine dehydrogenase 1
MEQIVYCILVREKINQCPTQILLSGIITSEQSMTWIVHKFGGTSVANADRYKDVARILLNHPNDKTKKAVVVSAMKGVTDALIDMVRSAEKQNPDWLNQLEKLKKQHFDTATQLTLNQQGLTDQFHKKLAHDFSDISEILRGVFLTKTASETIIELISGFGEIWSAQLLNLYLNSQGIDSTWLDARDVLIVEPHEKNVAVDFLKSHEKLIHWLDKNRKDLIIITGFVASTHDGLVTTLKRNGSDFSGSIFGHLFDAKEIIIWTDVDGVLSADPRLVPEAITLLNLSYDEITELAYFGAKVVHPATMGPAIEKNIPVVIKNTFNPSFPGTRIHNKSQSDHLVSGFSVIENMALINIEGKGMAGVPGIAEKIFSSLRTAGISIVFISQASSEHSICLSINEAQSDLAVQVFKKDLYAEIHQKIIEKIDVTKACSILAAVGDNMVKHAGVAGKLFTALARSQTNIKAIAQGSSEKNISIVIDSKDSKKALRAAHAAFYLSRQTLAVALIGTGVIGKAFLRQIKNNLEYLQKEKNLDIHILGLMNSKKMHLSQKPIALENWETCLEEGEPIDHEKFSNHIKTPYTPHAVIIEATANETIADQYEHWLKNGLHIITPNKKANTKSQNFYDDLRLWCRKKQVHFLYSTNVGAGLPIINTLRDLHYTGDKIISIEGVLSGTLSFIFNSYNGEKSFSQILLEAKNLGYTEPDPRDDLSGQDVARKIVILAREIGIKLDLDDIKIESLVPESLQKLSTAEFLNRVSDMDSFFSKKLAEAKGENKILRYVAKIDENKKASVQLLNYSTTHPLARLSGSDNMVIFTTERYNQQPLVIQGPGAGPEVTAAGVFSDLLRLSSYLGVE